MKHDIFISYSRKDFDEVYKLKKSIEVSIPKIDIWFDIDGIESGSSFDDKIISAIDNTSIILFALSDNSNSSEWARDEIMYAKNTGKYIIPVLLKDAVLKGWFLLKFGRIDCIDYTNPIQFNKMLRDIKKICELEEDIDYDVKLFDGRKRYDVLLLVDSSGSMYGERIDAINRSLPNVAEGMQLMEGDFDIRLNILSFSSDCKWMFKNPMPLAHYDEWKEKLQQIEARGLTSMGQAFHLLNEKLSRHGFYSLDSKYSGVKPPIIVLFSDGEPTDNVNLALNQLNENEIFKGSSRIAFALGDEVDMNLLLAFTKSKRRIFSIKDDRIGSLTPILTKVLTMELYAGSHAMLTEEDED